MSHAIPIETVQRIEVVERVVEGRKVSHIQGRRYAEPVIEVSTDISVHTTDGQTALWIVEQRSADWVRGKLAPIQEKSRIPLD